MTNHPHFIIEGIAPVAYNSDGYRCRALQCSEGFTLAHAREAVSTHFGPGWITRVINTDAKPQPRIYREQSFSAPIVQIGWTS